jgi:hypothetical protein
MLTIILVTPCTDKKQTHHTLLLYDAEFLTLDVHEVISTINM